METVDGGVNDRLHDENFIKFHVVLPFLFISQQYER